MLETCDVKETVVRCNIVVAYFKQVLLDLNNSVSIILRDNYAMFVFTKRHK